MKGVRISQMALDGRESIHPGVRASLKHHSAKATRRQSTSQIDEGLSHLDNTPLEVVWLPDPKEDE